MCENNPSYTEMIELVVSNALDRDLPRTSQVLDIGAGTGNLISSMAPHKPDWNFVHLDFDQGMNLKAKEKYLQQNIKNVSILQQSAEDSSFTEGSFDLILTTNAIYSIPGHEALMEKIHSWLHPKGTLIAVDFGRPQNTTDWMIYIAKNLVKTKGIRKTAKIFRDNWEAAKQNRRTTEAQDQGNYWVHDSSEFQNALEKAGFSVEKNSMCYRGYSDLAICTKTLHSL